MSRLFMFFVAIAVCAVMALGPMFPAANAQIRQSDRCEVHGACGWNFATPSDKAVRILRDAHEQKRKYRHYENGGNVFITNTHDGDVKNDNDFHGGQTYSTATTIGNIIDIDGDKNHVKAGQSVDESILGAEVNTWRGDCSKGCEQTSDDPSIQKGGGKGHTEPHK